MEKTKPPHCQNYINQNNIKLSDCNILIMCSSHRVEIQIHIKEKNKSIYIYMYIYIGIYVLLFKLMHTNWHVLAVGWTLWWFLVWFKVSKYLDINILVGLKIKYNYFFCVQCSSDIWTILTLSNINSIYFNLQILW